MLGVQDSTESRVIEVPPSGVRIEMLTDVFWRVQATDWMLPLFWSLSRWYAPCVVGEIGFRGGTSALAWLVAARDYGNGRVYSMDIDECRDGRELVSELGLSQWHTFIHADSKTAEFPEMLDILFIDGDHSAEGVRADRERHGARVKPGGLILYHDTISVAPVGLYVRSMGIPEIPLGAGLGIEYVP